MVNFIKKFLFPVENVEMVEPVKSTKEIIEEIHETFYTEVDRLLAGAKIMKSTETDKKDILDKAERLKKLGFGNTQEVSEANKESDRLSEIKNINYQRKKLSEAIEYFSTKYPMYKFITEESVRKICKKYGLIFGSVEYYKGTVPDKNLENIEKFTIDQEDVLYHQDKTSHKLRASYKLIEHLLIKINEEHSFEQRLSEKQGDIPIPSDRLIDLERRLNSIKKAPLEIAAPAKDFDLNKRQVVNHQIVEKMEIPDPIVLQPVMYDNTKYYLVVDAWGEESTDELVVNQKFN